MKHLKLVTALLAAGIPLAPAIVIAEPSEQQLASAVELGGLAALAPLCGLRDQDWSADLRRSTIQTSTGAVAYGDASLRSAPGSNVVIGALSYAETEATEQFAETPAATCTALAGNSILPRADEMVLRFRGGRPSS